MSMYRKNILLAICFTSLLTVVTASDDVTYQEWNNFKQQYDKQYVSRMSDNYRYDIFTYNKIQIAKHNELYKKGLVTYDVKVNKFADLLPDEFIKLMTGLDVSGIQSNLQHNTHFISPSLTSIRDDPAEVDWRTQGAVTRVKDQGACGSCWAFSVTGVLEGQYFLHERRLVELSEQNLLDCSTAYGNGGCNGGNSINSYEYMRNNHGINEESAYPYEGVQKDCRYNIKSSVVTIKGYTQLNQSEEELKTAVADAGPISVAVDASEFQFYNSGVFYSETCSPTKLNHAVLAVGYGSDANGGDFWLIKNSWGMSWGMDGYMKLARNRDNHCGIANFANYPLI